MRNSRNWLSFFIVAVLLIAPVTTAFAAVVDNEVEAAIANGESAIPVIITLKSSENFQNLLSQDLTREARIETLQARSAQSFESFAVTANFASRNFRQFWIINGIAVTASAAEVDGFASNPGVKTIEYDRTEYLAPEKAVDGTPRGDWTYGLENLGIPAIRSQFGLDGSGVVVGVIDTGVDGNHPDLQGKVIGFKDFVNGKTDPYDDQGHGSHCCGTIAGGNASGTQIGVAPNAKLIVAKVFSASGSTQTSYLLGAMEYMTDPDGDPSTDDAPTIVSNSWGGSGTSTTYLEVTRQWLALGIFPSFAAGNSGPSARTMGSPGSYLESFAVGATQANDSIASFSSRGPVTWDGVDHIKPDVSAPGHNVYSVKPGGGYTKMSGTSMACPHVSGVIALIHQASPGISINDVRELLEGTSIDFGAEGKDNTFGAGRVNALAAVEIAISGGRVSGNLADSSNNPLQGIVHIVENNIDIKVSASGQFMTTLPEGKYNLIGRAYGFVDSAPVEVEVVASGEHTVALKLKRAPVGTIAGKVIAADGGVMINATVRVLDTPVAPVVCTGGNFELTLPSGNYRLQVTAFGYATTLVEGLVVVASQSSDIVVEMAGLPEVLLVDDDAGKSYESYYTKSLDALGISYDVINVKEAGQLKADEVIAYANVIWFTGDDYQATLTDADQSILDEYLKKGGSLILSGQDLAYDIKRSDLLNKVLKVTFKDDSSNQKMVKGLDQHFSIFGGALNQKYAERYEVIAPASVLFKYDDGTCAAVYANTYAGKSATCGFGFEGIADGDRHMVIGAILAKVAATDMELISRIRFFETEEQMVRYAELHAHRLSSMTTEDLSTLQGECDVCRPLTTMINAELSNR